MQNLKIKFNPGFIKNEKHWFSLLTVQNVPMCTRSWQCPPLEILLRPYNTVAACGYHFPKNCCIVLKFLSCFSHEKITQCVPNSPCFVASPLDMHCASGKKQREGVKQHAGCKRPVFSFNEHWCWSFNRLRPGRRRTLTHAHQYSILPPVRPFG